jgi:predicted amidohydrolase
MAIRWIEAAVLQMPVTMDPARNVAAVERLLASLPANALVIAPEGVLSGYLPELGFVAALDRSATDAAIARAGVLARERRLHFIAGACVRDAGAWRNRSYYFGPGGEQAHYDKVNLAQSERGAFTPGAALPVFDIEIAGAPVRIGIQMCREIRYPEQWRVLAVKGAQIIAYVNNAIGSAVGDAVWRAHMISRAAEVQRFVLGANNAAIDQTCPSMIVAPSGVILAEAPTGAEVAAIAKLDLAQTSDWVLSQARTDIVSAP